MGLPIAKTVSGVAVRLIHNNEKLIAAFMGSKGSQTSTIHNIEEFSTPQAAYQRVIDLGLEYDETVFVEEYGQEEVDSWKV